MSVPSGVPLDCSDDSANFSLDDVDFLVHHCPFMKYKNQNYDKEEEIFKHTYLLLAALFVKYTVRSIIINQQDVSSEL